MFHFHPLPPFVMFHIIGTLLLLITAAVIARKVFRWRRYAHAGQNLGFRSSCGAMIRRSGNSAFDEYRQATLKKLEQEADEFRSYLDGLRRAADAAAFDAFLKSRRGESGSTA